jgi:hypothetical protein
VWNFKGYHPVSKAMLDYNRIAVAAVGIQTDCIFFSLESAPTGFFGYSAGKRTQEDFVPQSYVLFPRKAYRIKRPA